MRVLNNKGMSLIEILVSITLISTILVFLVQLLNNLESETTNNLIGVSNNSHDSINISFDFLDNLSANLTSTIKDDKYILKYIASNGEKHSWTMEGAEIDPCFNFAFHNDLDTNNYYFKLNIYIYNKPFHKRNNKEINNAIDDIEITYSSNNNFLSKDPKYLTIDNNSDKKINSCTN